MATTSCPPSLNADTTLKSQLSSARNLTQRRLARSEIPCRRELRFQSCICIERRWTRCGCHCEFAKRMEDADVIDLSNQRDRILITEDKDFGQLVYAHGQASVGVRAKAVCRDGLSFWNRDVCASTLYQVTCDFRRLTFFSDFSPYSRGTGSRLGSFLP